MEQYANVTIIKLFAFPAIFQAKYFPYILFCLHAQPMLQMDLLNPDPDPTFQVNPDPGLFYYMGTQRIDILV
jgi:hypothetical protein